MLVKVKFLRGGNATGQAYTYPTSLDLQVGDKVVAGRCAA